VSFIDKGLTGKDVEAALGEANITVNKNAVPNDPQSPFVTSGIRIGTPAITTRGFGEKESRELAGWICDILDHLSDASVRVAVKAKAEEICRKFPVYDTPGRKGSRAGRSPLMRRLLLFRYALPVLLRR